MFELSENNIDLILLVKKKLIEWSIKDEIFCQFMAEKWWNGVDSLEFDIESIDYRKYLNCPACKDVELYCSEHSKEVELIIASKSQKLK